MTPDIASLHQSNREQTSRFGNAAPTQGGTPKVSPIRDEVRTHGNQIRSDAASNRSSFDSKAEIIKTDDGTLASKKSLLVQSGKQVGKDAAATLDNAKDVVKDLLHK